jgi:hypothetical protein
MDHLESYRGHFTKIVKNSAQCKLCADIITSTHSHHFVTCRCGEISVDGGTQYIRRLANNLSNIKDLSESRNLTADEIKYVKLKSIKDMRQYVYSKDYYLNLIQAAEYFAEQWYGCKI